MALLCLLSGYFYDGLDKSVTLRSLGIPERLGIVTTWIPRLSYNKLDVPKSRLPEFY